MHAFYAATNTFHSLPCYLIGSSPTLLATVGKEQKIKLRNTYTV